MQEKKSLSNKELVLIGGVLFFGVVIRYFAFSLGHNWDFDSYVICGQLGAKLKNVYSHTGRYNYAPLFFCIQSICYKIALSFSPAHINETFRVLIVAILSLGDLTIFYYIYIRHGIRKAIIFFLNPVSVFITGYHNQFDNLAIALLLIAVCYYNSDDKVDKRDWLCILFMGLSLIMKHIVFLLPIWILFRKDISVKKKVLYAFVPPVIFAMSFVPFVLNNSSAFSGVINNVFKYRGYNNSPLLGPIYNILHISNDK